MRRAATSAGVGLVLAVSALSLGLSGCGEAGPAIPRPRPRHPHVADRTGEVNQAVRMSDGMSFTVTSVQEAEALANQRPAAGGVFVVVGLRAVNRTGYDVSIDSGSVFLAGGSGGQYRPDHGPALKAYDGDVFLDYGEVPEFAPATVSKGGDSAEIPDRSSHSGYLVFDVPRRKASGSSLGVRYWHYGEMDVPQFNEPVATAHVRLGL